MAGKRQTEERDVMPVIERYWIKVDKTGPVAVTADPAVAYDWAGSWPDGFKRDVIAVTPEQADRSLTEVWREDGAEAAWRTRCLRAEAELARVRAENEAEETR